jgi:predicted RNA-binding Zn-ribbon protein involved in translation (DUF1610 family)
MSYNTGGTCWNCGKELSANDYGRGDSCPNCGRDTRTCKGCEFYDASYNNQCKENQADRVVEKERANFCDYFKPASRKGAGAKAAADLKAAAEALFKKN